MTLLFILIQISSTICFNHINIHYCLSDNIPICYLRHNSIIIIISIFYHLPFVIVSITTYYVVFYRL